MYSEAIEQLVKYGRIVEEKDSTYVYAMNTLITLLTHLNSGKAYITSDHADMTWSCQALVATRHSWAEWRKSVFGMQSYYDTSKDSSLTYLQVRLE